MPGDSREQPTIQNFAGMGAAKQAEEPGLPGVEGSNARQHLRIIGYE
jgi:hypothetical protein